MIHSKKYYQIQDKSKKYLMDKALLEADSTAEFSVDSLRKTEKFLCAEFGFEPSKISKLKKGQETKLVRTKITKAKSDIVKKITESLDTANIMLENYQKFLQAGSYHDFMFPRYNKHELKEEKKTPSWTDQTKKQFIEKIENDRELFLRNVFPPEKILQLIENILTLNSESDINDKIYRFTIINGLLQKCLVDLYDNADINYKRFVEKDIDRIKMLSWTVLSTIESGKK